MGCLAHIGVACTICPRGRICDGAAPICGELVALSSTECQHVARHCGLDELATALGLCFAGFAFRNSKRALSGRRSRGAGNRAFRPRADDKIRVCAQIGGMER